MDSVVYLILISTAVMVQQAELRMLDDNGLPNNETSSERVQRMYKHVNGLFENGYQDYHGLKLKWYRLQRTFLWAYEWCQEEGGRLFMPRNNRELNLIYKFIKSIPAFEGLDDIWLGGGDIRNEGDFRWVDDSKISPSYFKAGEPNNSLRSCSVEDQRIHRVIYGSARRINVGENCVTLSYYGTVLSDDCCAKYKSYVCQKIN